MGISIFNAITTKHLKILIPEAKAIKLIEIYCLIEEKYHKDLQYCCQRFSNNGRPRLSDVEIMTIYLFAVHQEQRFKVKHIHGFANDYLREWFPELGSYTALNNRLNRLSEAFKRLLSILVEEHRPADCSLGQSLLDSMPIITCSGKRPGKVARVDSRQRVLFDQGDVLLWA